MILALLTSAAKQGEMLASLLPSWGIPWAILNHIKHIQKLLNHKMYFRHYGHDSCAVKTLHCWQVPLFNLQKVAIVLQLWCACPRGTVLHTGCLCVCPSVQCCHQKQPLLLQSSCTAREFSKQLQPERADSRHAKNKGVWVVLIIKSHLPSQPLASHCLQNTGFASKHLLVWGLHCSNCSTWSTWKNQQVGRRTQSQVLCTRG